MSGICILARAGLSALALAAFALPAKAQTYPERPIRFVLGFPPELVYARVLPGAAVSILVGNLFYYKIIVGGFYNFMQLRCYFYFRFGHGIHVDARRMLYSGL